MSEQPRRRKICKPLIRRNFGSFAIKCVQNRTTKQAMIKNHRRNFEQGNIGLCSKKVQSILKGKSKESFEKFQVNAFVKELKCTLLSILTSCLKTKTPRLNCSVMTTVIVALLCKHRNPSCSLLQRMTSLILYAGHSAKQVKT